MQGKPIYRNYIGQIMLLVQRLLIVYGAFLVCRVIFYYANKSLFPAAGLWSLAKNCFYGLRFDTFSIVIANSLFILLSILPLNLFSRRWYQGVLRILFIVTNAVFVAFNMIDAGYFPFIHKRSTAEIFDQLGGQTDVLSLIPQFARDFWWILLTYIALVISMYRSYSKTGPVSSADYRGGSARSWVWIIITFILTTGFCVLGVRGGLQRVPIDVVNAGAVTTAEETPVVLNTPFTIIKSFNQETLTEHRFFSEEELRALYSPVHHFKDSTFRKKNVVVLILESFGKEYTSLARGKYSLTPFLDSLMKRSLVCTNAYSNGTKSIEGIPAILAGLPSLMENPFINSIYANNRQSSLARILRHEGYNSAFFHGGINGTMNFDDWASTAGYDAYVGMKEYDNDADFDGFWGIWDEPFLQFSAKRIAAMKEPFHAAVFTLSSHHPYYVPEKYRSLPDQPYENSRSIAYADHSLRKFFETAKKMPWFNNTLFVLTADHGSLSKHPFYITIIGNESIPILFYEPGNTLRGEYPRAFSQTDIVPSVLSLLGYNKPFFSFGEPLYSPRPHNAYLYIAGMHIQFADTSMYRFTGPLLTSVFHFRHDSTMSRDHLAVDTAHDARVLRRHRAFIQTYNHVLNTNTGYLSPGNNN